MVKVSDINEIIASIAEIRNLKKGFLTNFYLDIPKHSLWIEKGVVFFEKIDETLFLVKKNADFWNVFFCSTVQNVLSKSIEIFNAKYSDFVLMYDIVANEKMLVSYKEVFDTRMHEYCSLVRMSKINSDCNYSSSEDVSIATVDMAKDILAILKTYFDKKTEQIPYIEEIRSLIQKENVFVYIYSGKIVGFTIFEKSISTLYLRYWFVNPDFRNKKIGSKLLNQFFYLGRNCKKHQLWVIETNYNAIVRYRHYGFNEENLYDVVYSNKELKYHNYER